jgi:pyrroloquinoline-quinone synthase
MEIQEFFERLAQSIAQYDLLRHPFYQAWTRGSLTREDLQEYAKDYYHHVESFPHCLTQFASRLAKSELREAVLKNLADEIGAGGRRSHADYWLDFAEGIGAGRSVVGHEPTPQMKNLMLFFKRAATEGTLEAALAVFYAYESQVPRVSREKWRGLTERYGASDRTCGYFILHTTADLFHSWVWRVQIEKRLKSNPERMEGALSAGVSAARHLWEALDGIESVCLERLPQVR